MPSRKIAYVKIIGDSLSDRRGMDERKVLGIIPGGLVSGLTFKSITGRFTNGLVWGDYFAEKIVRNSDPIATTRVNLDDSDEISAPWSTNFMHTYCEGGLTAHNYCGLDSLNLVNEITQEVLSNLDAKRKLLLEDDAAMCITAAEKQLTLIIEWSGANDLITVNSEPKIEHAVRAIFSRINNIRVLISAGYRNFTLFNLPDLSLTPRFQNGGEAERINVHKVSMAFNTMLEQQVIKLQAANPECIIAVHDVNKIFTDAYSDPVKFGLDPEKLRTPLVDGVNFRLTNVSTENGFMFWDDVHPTTVVHELLEETFYTNCFKPTYTFVPPEESQLQKFREAYGKKWADKKREGCCSWWRSPSIPYAKTDLVTAFDHAKKKQKGIAYEVFETLKQRKELSAELFRKSSAKALSPTA